MSHDPKNLEHALNQINALRERARLDALIREAQPASVSQPVRARVALILRKVFGRSAKSLGATRASADIAVGLPVLPMLNVNGFDWKTAQQRNSKNL